MPPSRSLRVAAALALLGLSACAGAVPWPPPAGACVEASHGYGKRARWRYRIGGAPATREDVEHAVGTSPAAEAAIARARRLEGLTTGLLIGGFPVTVGGILVTCALPQPLLLLPTAPGLAAFIVGLTLVYRTDDPFRQVVVDFNARVQRDGTCPRPPPPPAPPPRPPPAPQPVEELLHPRYGPPPFGG